MSVPTDAYVPLSEANSPILTAGAPPCWVWWPQPTSGTASANRAAGIAHRRRDRCVMRILSGLGDGQRTGRSGDGWHPSRYSAAMASTCRVDVGLRESHLIRGHRGAVG